MSFASIPSPTVSPSIPAVPLTPSAFSPYGSVIQNPKAPPAGSSTVNQGTASKYSRISPFISIKAPAGPPATANINLFVCKPRQLEHRHSPASRDEDERLREAMATSTGEVHPDARKVFRVKILERHPYTTQTFVPMGVDTEGNAERRYLVVVAPTLKETKDGKKKSPPESTKGPRNAATTKHQDEEETGSGPGLRPPPFPLRLRRPTKRYSSSNRPVPFTLPPPADNVVSASKGGVAGRGLPDLSQLKAFICTGSQAVTYGVGTWHAPMVALGDKEIDFVVIVHENGSGVGGQDTEECDIEGTGVAVEVPNAEEKKVRARL